jgi:nucleotide-binding universal stress UspA family protein
MEPARIERILAPVDFLDMTEEVTDFAASLAREFGAALTILHVVHVPPLAEASTWLEPVITPSVEQEMRLQLKAAAEAKLKQLAEQCGRQGVETGFEVREGVPFAEIIALAQEQKTDLIVMGSQGRRGLTHFLVGSVAERVVRRAHCNVLCVKPKPQVEQASN